MNGSLLATLFVAVCLAVGTINFAAAEDLPQPTPVFLWDRAVDNGYSIPTGPNVVVSAVAQMVVEFRSDNNGSSLIRGMNATNGAAVFTFNAQCGASTIFLTTIGDDLSFVIGCTNGFYVCSITTGAVQVYVEFAAGLTFAAVVDGANTGAGAAAAQYTVLQLKKKLILSLKNATSGLYGSLVYDVTLRKLTAMTTMLNCPSGSQIFQLYTAPGEQGYAQLCQTQQLLYVRFAANTSVPSWIYPIPAGGTVQAGTIFSYASSLANVAFVYGNASYTILAAFDVIGQQQTPMWTVNAPTTIIGDVVMLAQYHESIVAVGTTGAFAAFQGNISWKTLPAYFPDGLLPSLVVEDILGGYVLLLDPTHVYVLNALQGTVVNTVFMDNQILVPYYTAVVPTRWAETPLDSSVPMVSTLTENQLAVISNGNLQLVNILDGVMSESMGIPGYTGPSGPLSVLQGVYPSSSQENVLVMQTQAGLLVVSLTFAWTLMDAQYIGQQDAVLFLNSGASGSAVAVDRNGNTIWEHPSPFNAQVGAPFGFANNVLLDVIGSSAIAAYNSYNGSLIATKLITNDCKANTSLASPSLNGFAADKSLSNAYFAASLPCLFRIENTLTMHTIPLPFTISSTPVVDDDNGVAYLYTQYQIFSISIPLGLTVRKLYTTSSKIIGVVPSSTLSSPENLNKGYNPIVFVFTNDGITALNVIDLDNTYVWNIGLPNIATYTFYNNSAYVLSTTNGLCRISLNVSLNATQRLLWCVRASVINNGEFPTTSLCRISLNVSLNATQRLLWCVRASVINNGEFPTTSNIVFSNDGTLFVAVASNVWTLDANTAKARWRLAGQVTINDEDCSQLLIDQGYGILYVSCANTVTALDIFQLGRRLFYLSYLTNMNLYYFPGTLFVGQTHQSASGVQVPTMFLNRGATPPAPSPTNPFSAETVPPNFIPKPEIPTALPPYPTPQSGYPEAATIKAFSVSSSLAISYGSSTSNDNLFLDRVFLTPHISEDTGACVVQEYNAVSLVTTWRTPIDIGGCACSSSVSKIVGNSTATAVFVFICGQVLYAYRASNGAALWNTSSSSTYLFQLINYLPGDILVGVTMTQVVGFNLQTGAQTFVVALQVNGPQVAQTFEPVDAVGQGYLVVVGTLGLQVIRIPMNAPSQANTTLVVSPGNGPSQPDILCSASRSSLQYGVAAATSNDFDVYKNMTAAYFACSHNILKNYVAVFRVDFLTSTVAPIVNVSVGASVTINSLLVKRLESESNDPSVQLYLNLDKLLYKIETNTTTLNSKIAWIVASSTTYNPTMAIERGLVLISAVEAGAFNSRMQLVAYNDVTGSLLWNTSIASPYTFLQGQDRFATTTLSNGLLLLGGIGLYAINVTTGSIAWAAQTSNQGMVRSVTSLKSAPFAVPASASDILVSLFTASFYATTEAFFIAAMTPAAVELSPRLHKGSFFWDAYIDPASQVLSIVSVDPYMTQLHSIAHDWSVAVNGPAAVYTRVMSINGSPAVPVVFSFESYEIRLYHANSGQLLSTFLRTDACNVAAGNPLTAPVPFSLVGNYAVFVDMWCVYRIDVTTRSMTAVVISPLGKVSIQPNTPFLVTADNSTVFINGVQGAVYGITVTPTFQLAWVNDANQFFVLKSLAGIALPQYDITVPNTAQQLLGYTSEGVVSLSVTTGQMLWVWLYSRKGIQSLYPLNDGTALITAAGNYIVKLSLQVSTNETINRLVWQSTSPGPIAAQCLHPVPDTQLVVYATEINGNVIGFNHSSGETMWSAPNVSAQGCNYITSVRFPNAPSNRPAPMFIISSDVTQYVISTVDGGLKYYFTSDATQAKVQEGQVVFFQSNNLAYSALPFPTPLKFPKYIASVLPPTVPAGYSFQPLPLPSSSVQGPFVVPPQAPTSWIFNPNLGVSDSGAFSYSTLVQISGRDMFLTLTVSVGFGSNDVYALTIIDALSGVQQRHTVSFGGTCDGTWMGGFGNNLIAIGCSSTASLILLDVSTTQPRQVANTTGVEPAGNDFLNSISFVLSDYNLACVVQNAGTSFACIDTKSTNPTFASVVYTFTCPVGYVLADDVFYHDTLQRVVSHCLAETAGFSTLFGIDAQTGAAVWNNSFGGGRQIYQLGLTRNQNFGAVLYDTTPPTGATVALFSLSTGVTPGQSYSPLAGTALRAGDVMEFYFVEATVVPVTGTFVLATSGSIFGFDLATNRSNWTTPIGGGQSIGAALIKSPSTGRFELFVVPQTGSLRVLDVLTGNVVFAEIYQGPQADTFVSWVPVFYGATTLVGVLFTYQSSVLYWDATSYTVSYYPVQSAGSGDPSSTAAVYTTASNDLVIDVASNSGVVTQLVVNISGATAVAGTHFGVIQDPTPSNGNIDFLLVSEARSTYLYSPTGVLLWGTMLTYSTQGESGSFDPAAFSPPNTRSVVIKSLLPRTFAGFDLVNGSVVYTGYLPLCDGDGAGLTASYAVSAADATNNILYVSVQNPCLYAINAATGQVSVTQTPTRSPILIAPVLSTNCVLIMDTFGELMCIPRGPAGSLDAPTAATTWRFPFGYLINSANIAPVVTGNFVLVNMGDVLYCLREADGTLVWQLELGSHLVFSVGSNNTVWACTWTGVYGISLNPTAAQRILWFTSTASLFGTPYNTGYTYLTAIPPPVQTINGYVIVTFGKTIVALSSTTGAKRFNATALSSCTTVTYSTAPSWQSVFIAQCGTVGVYSVVTGALLSTLGSVTPLNTVSPVLLPNNGGIAYALPSATDVILMPMPDFILNAAPVAPVAPTAAPTPFTLPPGFSPQGVYTPIPTLAPGATLPPLSCVLNVEALYPDLVSCVNDALVASYDNQNPNFMYCTKLAENTAPCVANWINNVIPSCNAAMIYLENVLIALNHSTSFGYCANPNQCSDGAVGSHAICELVNAATSRTGGATLPPQMPWPRPADQIPQFTIPTNTAKPTTAGPSTTTGAPAPTTTTTAAPGTPVPGAPTTKKKTSTTTGAPAPTTTTTTAAPGTPVPGAPTTKKKKSWASRKLRTACWVGARLEW
ncbi:Hypothetical protein, putative [Bodo saltans]|uniref:Membrane-associated protein n=1 Tax=Bodo saltans TaxID=75058 RepID=A0A0S4JIA1_BODSA|nr:Hypothetical protein, putative [Bodo saltans]|eukprot:CUG91180.1 Hypothetical protein, putative [Bodo saltans]